MTRTTLFVGLGIAAVLGLTPLSYATQATYLPGFTWDWRVDFGEPSDVSELPPNPNSDYASRSLAANSGLSSGPQVDNVWQYGNTPYSALTGGTLTSSDFTIFTKTGTHSSDGRPVYFWSDSSVLTGDWDSVVYIPPPHPLHPGHSVSPDSYHSQAVVIRWLYPGDSQLQVRISGVVKDGNGNPAAPNDGVDFYLFKNSAADLIDFAVIPNGQMYVVDAAVGLAPGDELFLGVGYLNNDGSDTTLVDLTFQVVPEPATLSLLVAGLGAIWLKRRR